MELLKDYDCTIEYNPGKVNVMADALSRNTRECITGLNCHDVGNLVALQAMNISFDVEVDHLLLHYKLNHYWRIKYETFKWKIPI